MASLYLRGDVWWAKYRQGGQVIRTSTGCTRKNAARDWLDVRAGRIAEGQPVPVRLDRVLYDELRADLWTHYMVTGKLKHPKDTERRLRHLDAFFRGWPAVNITSAAITAYVAKRQVQKVPRTERTVSNAEINRELAALRKMLRHALHQTPPKILRVPKIELLPEAPARAGFVDDAQFAAIARRLEADVAVAAFVGYECGWRLQEVLGLEWPNVNLATGELRIDPGETKNRDARVCYVTDGLKRMLAEQRARVTALDRVMGRVIPWVFPHLRGPLRGERRRGYIKQWRAACIAAGVPGRIVHDLRRSAVRNMERDGVPRSVATAITGHRTESIYRRYAIVSDADLRAAAARRAQFGHSLAPEKVVAIR